MIKMSIDEKRTEVRRIPTMRFAIINMVLKINTDGIAKECEQMNKCS